MKDDEFAEELSALIRELDPAPPAPRAAIWSHIDAARRGRRRGEARSGAVGAAPRTRPGRWARQARWAAPLAAALLIGIAIGREFRPAESGPQEPATASARDGAPSSVELPYRMVAAEHLDAAEALLAALPHDARRGDVAAVSSWAEELIVTTRLLLDSPAADDPYMAALFRDLELVLAQVASISAAQAEGEVELIEEGIRQNNVLLRVRAATMQRAQAGT